MATFNTETVAEKSCFRSAFKNSRCLIPVSGTARDGSPALTIAGLWDEWRDKASGETLKCCTMIITEPNKFVAAIHDRTPVLLAQEDYEPWLSGKAGLELLKPAPEDLLQCWSVSKRVNSSRAPDDDPTLIEAVTV